MALRIKMFWARNSRASASTRLISLLPRRWWDYEYRVAIWKAFSVAALLIWCVVVLVGGGSIMVNVSAHKITEIAHKGLSVERKSVFMGHKWLLCCQWHPAFMSFSLIAPCSADVDLPYVLPRSKTKSSATAEEPLDARCQLKSYQLLRRCTKNCSKEWPWRWLKVIRIVSIR